MMLKSILILTATLLLNACDMVPRLDEVIPDRRTEYQKSEALPELEVPPDLTTDALNDPLAIPNEEATTLSEFERRKNTRQGGAVTAGGVGALADDQWLTLQGSVADIWPKLREFWSNKGYSLELDDADLGVLETGWLESGREGITVSRDKFSLLTEAGEPAGTTVIFITHQRQEKITGEGDSSEWVEVEGSKDIEKQMVGELNLYFYGNAAPAGASSLSAAPPAASSTAGTATAASKPRAEILNLGEDKIYLALPDEFTRAWTLTEDAILKSGMLIDKNDRSKGIYYVIYLGQQEENEEGLLSKLKFWGNDAAEGTAYQISLTGVGDKTELVVLNEKGDWAEKTEATKILTYIQSQYNNVR